MQQTKWVLSRIARAVKGIMITLPQGLTYHRIAQMVLAIGLCIGVLYTISTLIVSDPVFMERLCPPIKGQAYKPGSILANSFASPIDCSAILRNNSDAIHRTKKYQWCLRTDLISAPTYINLTKNCDKFKKVRGYYSHAITREEEEFPIAFSILMFESVEQVERLIRAIYRPQNSYCIHIDAKAAKVVKDAMTSLANCFENVFIASKMIDVRWAEFPVLEAEIVCLGDLWKHPKWKYFINLTGREFPIRTNWELVQILKVYNGSNDIDGTPHKRPIVWTKYVWKNENWHSNIEKTPVPHGFILCKGSTHIAASRGFVDFVLHDQRARDLLEWMKDIRTPDEHYFNTLNHNPQFGIPGAYKGDPDLKPFYTRYKLWQDPNAKCHGKWWRFICNLGAGDLTAATKAPQLFINKFRLEFDSFGFQCMEEWYLNRTKEQINTDFNISFYKKLPFVTNHV